MSVLICTTKLFHIYTIPKQNVTKPVQKVYATELA
jgi:hypothetical protein